MNLNHSYLHLIQALYCVRVLAQLTAVVTEEIQVFQTPPEIKAFEGDTISMKCSCEQDEMIESIRVDWTKDAKSLLQVTTMKPAHINRSFSSVNGTTAKLTIKNIVQHDSGMYFCEMFVEIPPPVQRGLGNGTKLTVQAYQNYSPKFVALILLVIIIPAILCYKQRQKRQRNARVPDGIAMEIINEENRENGGNEENLSSRGSSHWMTSSLYDSFDYFTIKQEEDEETCCKISDS